MKPADETRFLRELVSTPSVTGNTGTCAQFLRDRFLSLGYSSEIDSAGNVLAAPAPEIPASPRVLFCGHYDTVSGEIPVRVEKNELWGRGSVDAKGCIAAFASAVDRLAGAGAPPDVVLACCPDEEGPSLGAQALINRFSPRAVVIGEPSGASSITIGYRGNLKIRVRFSTGTHHKSMQVFSANDHAIEYWNRVRAFCGYPSPQKNPFEHLDAYLLSMHSRSDGLIETAELEIGLRLPPDLDPHVAETQLRSLAGTSSFEVLSATPAFRAGRANALVNAFAKAIRSKSQSVTYKQKTGTSDMNLLGPAWNTPILAYGPGDSSLDHAPDERLNIDEFSKSIDVIVAALEKLGESEIRPASAVSP